MNYWIKFYHGQVVHGYIVRQPAARSCLLVILATCLGGVWSWEQPDGSVMNFYPSFREMLCSIFGTGGPYAVIASMDSIAFCSMLIQIKLICLFLLRPISSVDLMIVVGWWWVKSQGQDREVVDGSLRSTHSKTALGIQQWTNSFLGPWKASGLEKGSFRETVSSSLRRQTRKNTLCWHQGSQRDGEPYINWFLYVMGCFSLEWHVECLSVFARMDRYGLCWN